MVGLSWGGTKILNANIRLIISKLLPRALDVATSEDVLFREGLPINFLSYMGVSKSDLVSRGQSIRSISITDNCY